MKKQREKKLFSRIFRAINLKSGPGNILKVSDSIDECTVYQFKMVHNKKDLRYLIKLRDYENLPDVDEKQLFEPWEKILNEWSEVVGGNRAGLALLKERRLYAMKQMLDVELIVLKAVANLPVPEMVQEANDLGYKIDPANIHESIQRAYGKAMKKKAKIEIEEKNQAKEESDEGIDGIIVSLERHQGYGFNQKEMTVRHLASIYKQVKADGKRRENKKK